MTPDWIAIDWGTTNLRAWAMSAGGDVLATARSDAGMGRLPPGGFEPALRDLLADWAGAAGRPMVACGMVGARQGWVEAPYRPVPATPLAGAAARPGGPLDIRILPGLRQDDPPDVMRGEETQIAGLLALEPGFEGVACLPGSHTKWADIRGGRVERFRTAMTGEIFEALSTHTILRHTVDDAWDDDAFADAAAEGMARPADLALAAFGLRAGALLKGDGALARARLSGRLIGAELAATRSLWADRPVAIVGAPKLAALYAAALGAAGTAATRHDGDACTLGGLRAAHALTTETS